MDAHSKNIAQNVPYDNAISILKESYKRNDPHILQIALFHGLSLLSQYGDSKQMERYIDAYADLIKETVTEAVVSPIPISKGFNSLDSKLAIATAMDISKFSTELAISHINSILEDPISKNFYEKWRQLAPTLGYHGKYQPGVSSNETIQD